MKNYILLLALTFATGAYCGNPYQDGSTVTSDGITFEVKLSKYSFFYAIRQIQEVKKPTGVIKMVENWRRKTNMLL